MLKQKLKIYLKFTSLLFSITFILTNCEDEEVFVDNEASQEARAYKINTVSLEQIPDISSSINLKANRNVFSKSVSSRDEIAGAIFDQDNILEVIDTLNQTIKRKPKS